MKNDNLNKLKQQIIADSEANFFYNVENQMSRICAILKEIRKEKGLTQEEIADRTGLSHQMISKIETYNCNPSLSVLIKYCMCLEIDLASLLSQKYFSQPKKK